MPFPPWVHEGHTHTMFAFKRMGAHKRHIHEYLLTLPGRLHAIDTKHRLTETFFRGRKPVSVFGFDFGELSTDYLKRVKPKRSDIVWLDYCATPMAPFVTPDLTICNSEWVFCTFSTRNCKWRSKINEVRKGTGYRKAWVYAYCDTSPMILVAYYRDHKPPLLRNPVGHRFKFLTYERRCVALVHGPRDDPVLYLKFKDSNEPYVSCVRV